MVSPNNRIIGPNEIYARWDVNGVNFKRVNYKSLINQVSSVCDEIDKTHEHDITALKRPQLDNDEIDINDSLKQMHALADYYHGVYEKKRADVKQKYDDFIITKDQFDELKEEYQQYRDIAKSYRFQANELKRTKKEDRYSRKYVGSITTKLSDVPFAENLLCILPGEPSIPIAGNKIYVNRTHIKLSTVQREKIRLALINSRIINWKWMIYQNHRGELRNSTPYFLNALGKFFYSVRFQKSPDSTAKTFYQNRAVQNRVFSVLHITLLENYYRSHGHDVEVGKYPFDLIVDNKHGFVCTEFHENSIGIEMRLSEAMYQCDKHDMLLYLPAMNGEHRRRIDSIMAGLLFEGNVDLYTYVTYLESQICSNTSVTDWSYIRTKKDHDTISPLPDYVLPFPKVSVDSSDIVQNEMIKTEDDQDDLKYLGGTWDDGISTKKKKKKKDRTKFGHEFKYPTRYINGLKNKEIGNGIRVTVGVGQIGNLWRKMSVGADVIITGICRKHIRDAIKMSKLPDVKKYPDLLIVNDATSEVHENLIKIFESHGTHVKRLYKNHGKAVLNDYQLLIHSMTTTNYMGNNRESYCLIDFSEHMQRDFIKHALVQMFKAYGNADANGFIKMWQSIVHYFDGKLAIFGHFSKHDYKRSQTKRKSGKTIKWVFYKEVIKFGSRDPLKVYTSHLDMRKIALLCDELKIQGTSRFSNHLCNMDVGGRVVKERLWHPRLVYNKHVVGLGSWDFSQILDQKEIQVMLYLDNIPE
jgi:hypothetical protein